MTPTRVTCTAVLALALLFLLPSSGLAQSATIGVYYYDGPSACPVETTSSGQVWILNVKLVHTAGPLKTAKFKLVPSCPGATILGALDYDLTFPSCVTDGATLATIYITQTPASCSDPWGFYFDVLGPAGETLIPLTDCDGYPLYGIDAFRVTDGPPCDDLSSEIAPYRPTPADGATDVPTDTELSWVGPANTVELSTEPLVFGPLICGTNCSNPPGPMPCSNPIDPGVLLPNTTYYWRASTWYVTHYWCDVVWSQVFSFTTGDGPVATESSTWGRVKAMYRE